MRVQVSIMVRRASKDVVSGFDDIASEIFSSIVDM